MFEVDGVINYEVDDNVSFEVTEGSVYIERPSAENFIVKSYSNEVIERL